MRWDWRETSLEFFGVGRLEHRCLRPLRKMGERGGFNALIAAEIRRGSPLNRHFTLL